MLSLTKHELYTASSLSYIWPLDFHFKHNHCVCVCVHVGVCVCVCACMRSCMHVVVCACMHACMWSCVHACMRACGRMCVHACLRTYVLICSLGVCFNVYSDEGHSIVVKMTVTRIVEKCIGIREISLQCQITNQESLCNY